MVAQLGTNRRGGFIHFLGVLQFSEDDAATETKANELPTLSMKERLNWELTNTQRSGDWASRNQTRRNAIPTPWAS